MRRSGLRGSRDRAARGGTHSTGRVIDDAATGNLRMLLRAHREGPRRSAAEQRDELAAFHSILRESEAGKQICNVTGEKDLPGVAKIPQLGSPPDWAPTLVPTHCSLSSHTIGHRASC